MAGLSTQLVSDVVGANISGMASGCDCMVATCTSEFSPPTFGPMRSYLLQLIGYRQIMGRIDNFLAL